jgi:hypothetical protein
VQCRIARERVRANPPIRRPADPLCHGQARGTGQISIPMVLERAMPDRAGARPRRPADTPTRRYALLRPRPRDRSNIDSHGFGTCNAGSRGSASLPRQPADTPTRRYVLLRPRPRDRSNIDSHGFGTCNAGSRGSASLPRRPADTPTRRYVLPRPRPRDRSNIGSDGFGNVQRRTARERVPPAPIRRYADPPIRSAATTRSSRSIRRALSLF